MKNNCILGFAGTRPHRTDLKRMMEVGRLGKSGHGVGRRRFPHCGNILSIVWKNGEKFFHCVEKSPKLFPLCGKNGPFFPQCGKYFSIVWKNREIVFHTVENLAFASM